MSTEEANGLRAINTEISKKWAQKKHKAFKKEVPQKTWENWKVSPELRTPQPIPALHMAMTHPTLPSGNNYGGGNQKHHNRPKKKKKDPSYSHGHSQIEQPWNRERLIEDHNSFRQPPRPEQEPANEGIVSSLPQPIGWRKGSQLINDGNTLQGHNKFLYYWRDDDPLINTSRKRYRYHI